MKRDDGGSAFPIPGQRIVVSYGMSLRDWFEGQALAGMTSCIELMTSVQSTAKGDGIDAASVTAACAYDLADAMLVERGK